MTIQRGEKADKKEISLSWEPEKVKRISDLGLAPLDLFVGKVVEDSAAAKAGLKVGDQVLKINGKLLENWTDLVKEVRAFGETKVALDVEIMRDGAIEQLKMSPTPVTQADPITGKEKTFYAIGITTSLIGAPPKTTEVSTSNPIEALSHGVKASYDWSVTTVLSFWKLLSNEVSAKSIGGPIMIGQLASQSFQIGISAFLKIMGIISINLFILNLLPLPVLDGGHLLFYTIEAIRGKPISMRVLEVAQTFGLILLLSLMVFATFNDITRAFGLNL